MRAAGVLCGPLRLRRRVGRRFGGVLLRRAAAEEALEQIPRGLLEAVFERFPRKRRRLPPPVLRGLLATEDRAANLLFDPLLLFLESVGCLADQAVLHRALIERNPRRLRGAGAAQDAEQVS